MAVVTFSDVPVNACCALGEGVVATGTSSHELNEILIWRGEDRQRTLRCIAACPVPFPVSAMCCIARGAIIGVGGTNGGAQVLLDNGSRQVELGAGRKGAVSSIIRSPDGVTVGVVREGSSAALILYDIATGAEKWSSPPLHFNAACFVGPSRVVAAGSGADASLHAFDLRAEGATQRTLARDDDGRALHLHSVCRSTENTVFSGSESGVVAEWDLRSLAHCMDSRKAHAGEVWALCVNSRQPKQALSVGADGTLQKHDFSTRVRACAAVAGRGGGGGPSRNGAQHTHTQRSESKRLFSSVLPLMSLDVDDASNFVFACGSGCIIVDDIDDDL